MHDQNHIIWSLIFHYEKSKQKYNFESNLKCLIIILLHIDQYIIYIKHNCNILT